MLFKSRTTSVLTPEKQIVYIEMVNIRICIYNATYFSVYQI